MYQFFVDPGQICEAEKTVTIMGSDVNHIKNVLRMKVGEEIAVSNGRDAKEYRCAIRSFGQTAIDCELRFVKEDGVELPVQITLFQGLPKADKMEWIIQKAVELGVTQIVPVATKRSIVKWDDKKSAAKVSRWQAIAEAAAKQSKRGVMPKVEAVLPFAQAVDRASEMERKLIPYELSENMAHTRDVLSKITSGERVAVFIGPEGGFDEEEVKLAKAHGVEPVTLGKRILRTETAGLTVLSWLVYLLEQE